MLPDNALRVLLVDDEPLILASYRRLLQSVDAQIRLAEGPVRGLDALEESPADVVVADYRMPGMNGDEFLEQVRRRWPQSVRILITAYSDGQVIEEALRRGEIFRFLIKPCDPNRLRQAIADALEQSKRLREVSLRSAKRELDLHTFRHLFESSLDPMMIADLNGDLIEVNQAFIRSHGRDRQEVLECHPKITTSLESSGHAWNDIRDTLIRDGHWAGELTRPNYRGLLTISELSDDMGECYAYAAVEKDVTTRHRLEEQSRAAQYEVILALARLAEFRDPETGAHLERMRRYCRILAETMSRNDRYADTIDTTYIEAIYNSSPLHDIGKVGVPDSILLKPGKLTDEEWRRMQDHTLIGAEVLSAAGRSLSDKNWLSLALTIALQHHEKYDGTGYPRGLKGDEIDLSARLVALADAYDAITSKRSYKAALGHDIARQRIIEAKGTHFDPDIVDAFFSAEDEIVTVRQRFNDGDLVEDDHVYYRRALGS